MPGKHHPNELDRLLNLSRAKALKHIVQKCEKLPNMDFNDVIDELEVLASILKDCEKEVKII